MHVSRRARIALRVAAVLGFAVIYVPLLLVLVNSFNPDRSSGWPPSGATFHWWREAWRGAGVRDALWTSVKAGLGATAIALVLGTLVAFAVARYRFFGREVVSFAVVLPIALPGIITGVALNTAFRTVLEPIGIGLGLLTVVVGHATFCVVVVFNNVAARLRRLPGSYEEAAMDLGADTFRTFRDITFPLMRSALVAGGLLAFALSFDEIVVTTFTAGPGVQTLPVWIFSNMARPQQAPVVNVVAVVLVVLSVVPVYAAHRLSSGGSFPGPAPAGARGRGSGSRGSASPASGDRGAGGRETGGADGELR
ncbi:ABC transporter permease [Streptomyces sp. NPDC050658]|uniref:ABC transporter permease n=1 Tax=unclassified Streptomyces TaxID=2593676 RepID=UPI00341C3541